MARYRKKPVEVSAWLIADLCHAAQHDWSALPPEVVALYDQGGLVFTPEGMHIPTLEGSMFGGNEDMLIEGVQGEFYPCKPDIFAATYDPAGQ